MLIKNNLPATKLFRTRSAVERRSMKTSASSIRSIAPQLLAVLKCFVRLTSTVAGSVPMSLDVKTINGRFVKAAIHSAQIV